MKTWDLFMYNGEDDLLKIRLETHKDLFDYFLIIESEFSHSGLFKGLQFNVDKFREFKDQIIYISANVKHNQNYWYDEFSFREILLQNAIQNGIQGDDLIFHSDLDEIGKPEILKQIIDSNIEKPTSLLTEYYIFCLDLWGRKSIDGFFVKKDWVNVGQMHQLRRYRTNEERKDFIQIDNAGWHYSSVGTPEQIVRKLHHYAHANECSDYVRTPEYIKEVIKNKRGGIIKDAPNNTLIQKDMTFPNCPKYLEENLDKYKHLLYSNYI